MYLFLGSHLRREFHTALEIAGKRANPNAVKGHKIIVWPSQAICNNIHTAAPWTVYITVKPWPLQQGGMNEEGQGSRHRGEVGHRLAIKQIEID